MAQPARDSSVAMDSQAPAGTFHRHGVRGRVGLMAIGLATRVAPAYDGRTFTEGYLTQPNLMADARWRALTFTGTLNAEGYTLARGELTPGIYGEGYVDRRHPHTLLHEAMLSLATSAHDGDGFAASLSAGKGFAPYGTDDPMMRPFVKYPVNHHHAQVLERVQLTGALRFARNARDITVEAGLFNGDEPDGPFAVPRFSRLTDSRAIRLTLRPFASLELQAGTAHVVSPDIIQGGASDREQYSASARWERALGPATRVYAFAEYARTDETHLGRRHFRYESMLTEAAATWRGLSAAARFERTDRPEKGRLLDPFRTKTGHIDFQILGITRWSTATVQIGAPAVILPRTFGGARVVPFVEVARAVPAALLRPTVFEPGDFYGSTTLWSSSAGLRLHLGTMRSRMGRYGVALPRASAGAANAHHH